MKFIKMNLGLSQNNEFIEKLTGIIQANLDREPFGGKEISRETGWSIIYINRRLQKITKKTLRLFIREIRLKKAMELLKDGSVTAAEAAYRVGFCNPAYFNTCFSEYYGFPPGEVRKKILNGHTEENVSESTVQAAEIHRSIPDKIRKGIIKIPAKKILPWMVPVILFLTILNVFGGDLFRLNLSGKDQPENDAQKNIAVLPFRSENPDSTDAAIMNGMMDAIYENLCKVKSLSVISRGSVEKYRNVYNKSIPRIGRELGVKYVVEGSCRQIVGRKMLSVHLVDAEHDRQLFSRQYQVGGEDIFAVMSELAMDVAAKTDAEILPREVDLIQKPSTTSLDALIAYQRGMELRDRAVNDWKTDYRKMAREYYLKAVRLDPGYSDAYVALAGMSNALDLCDSAMIYADMALACDSTNAKALAMKAFQLRRKGKVADAEKYFYLAVKSNPNYSFTFRELGVMYSRDYGDNVKAAEFLLKTFRLENNTSQQHLNLLEICVVLSNLGLNNEGKVMAQKLVEFNNDSNFYYWFRIYPEWESHVINYRNNSLIRLSNRLPNNNYELYRSILTNLYSKDFKRAYVQLEYLSGIVGKIRFSHNGGSSYLGLVCLKNSQIREADFYFRDALEVGEHAIKREDDSRIVCKAYFDLAAAWSALGEKEKALRNLREGMNFREIPIPMNGLVDLKYNPVYDPIRNEPLFREYVAKVENRIIKDRKAVREMLKSNGIIL